MTKKNCLKILVMLGLALLTMLFFTNNVEAADEQKAGSYELCVFRIVTIDGNEPTQMGQSDYKYQEMIYDIREIQNDFFFQLNTGINLGKSMNLEGLGKFTLSRTYTTENGNKTYYEYKSEVKDFNKFKIGMTTLKFDLKNIDNNTVQDFTLDLGFVSENLIGCTVDNSLGDDRLHLILNEDKLIELFNTTNGQQRLKNNVINNTVYDYAYIELPDGTDGAKIIYGDETEQTAKVLSVDEKDCIQIPFNIATLINDKFYFNMSGHTMNDMDHGKIAFTNGGKVVSTEEWTVDFSSNFFNYIHGFDIELVDKNDNELFNGGSGDIGYSNRNYDREKLAAEECYIKLTTEKNLGDTIKIDYFGTLKYEEDETNKTIYTYKAKVTDKSIFNKDILAFQFFEYGDLTYITLKFSGNKIEIEQPIEIIDKTTNIKLEADTTVVPEDTKIVVNRIENGSTYETAEKTLKDIVSKMYVYDITLKSNNAEIQPNGKVKISIPIPEDYNKANLVVYRIDENGTKTEYTVKVLDNYAVFETDHFSTYVLAEKANIEDNTQTEEPQGEHIKDETPKTGSNDIATIVCSILSALSAVGIAIVKKF